MKQALLLAFAFAVKCTSMTFAQCAVAPTFPGCTPAGATALTTGAVITAGNTMYFSGTGTLASVTVDGGTLIVCGNLTLNSFTVNSGTIYVNTGASLNLSGGVNMIFGNNTNYYNSGTSTFSGHVIINANSTVINDFQFSTPFNYLIVQGLNSVFVNNYNTTCGGIMAWTPSSPGCFCLGGNSWTTVNAFLNRTTNSFVVPSGNACLNVRQYVDNDFDVAATAALNVCVPSSISYSGLPNWGSATVNTNCNACLVPLPVELLSFTGEVLEESNVLNWTTATEDNSCYFDLERSEDGISFSSIGTLYAAGFSTANIIYSREDAAIDKGKNYYYRLIAVDCDGTARPSELVYLKRTTSLPAFITGNVTDADLPLNNAEVIRTIEVHNSIGQVMQTNISGTMLEMAHLPAGMYFVKITASNGSEVTYKVMKL